MKTDALPGDYVEIHLTRIIYEGILLESPETEKSVVLLKLDSGYNIGFNKKDILEIKVVRKDSVSSALLAPALETKGDRKSRANARPPSPKKLGGKPNVAMIIT
ncbi:unnamed protein product, partial [marine sediment metagenome]